ncbi:uncharacterized protein J4E88_000846 [Alternaria novae-zelandiae]|uniref:uncharacterized protein n=1 Tax=Alternaria novae-zelandiae TaxID=430562 RepID=UPI0020C3AE20|nr:uncharacterized protein J4E88_000846 [Alternaria novae-zelandiae]KAI4696668.1 hypothetical protein J4E88_000846 [Alternaria novae-zelandiae]
MQQSEAMWIKFDADRLYVIRIYVDNVNVVTGQTSQVQGQQDYVIVPDQAFLNGYKSNINALTTQFRRPRMTVRDFTRKYELQFEDGTVISARLTSQEEQVDGMKSDHVM